MTPPQHGSLLEVDGVRRRFGGRTAVDGLSFAVTPGRIVGFLGPNGAGSSRWPLRTGWCAPRPRLPRAVLRFGAKHTLRELWRGSTTRPT